MTSEELKEHCKKQIESCEMWAKAKGEEPSGRVYEEHKLILELLGQEPCEDAVSRTKAIEICKSRGHDNSAHYISELPPVTPQQQTSKYRKEARRWKNKALGQRQVLDEIKAEIERQEKWLWQAGINPYNVDIAFSSIKSVLAESEEG